MTLVESLIRTRFLPGDVGPGQRDRRSGELSRRRGDKGRVMQECSSGSTVLGSGGPLTAISGSGGNITTVAGQQFVVRQALFFYLSVWRKVFDARGQSHTKR